MSYRYITSSLVIDIIELSCELPDSSDFRVLKDMVLRVCEGLITGLLRCLLLKPSNHGIMLLFLSLQKLLRQLIFRWRR